MLDIIHCSRCKAFMGEADVPGHKAAPVFLCVECSRARRLDAYLAQALLATPERPIAGVEQYDRVPPPAEAKGREVLACNHGHQTANFQCMRCLGRSRLCDKCSMAGVCLHCGQRQPRSVEVFMDALEAGLNDAPLTPAEMGAEARALDEHFGDDIKIRIWGNEGRE